MRPRLPLVLPSLGPPVSIGRLTVQGGVEGDVQPPYLVEGPPRICRLSPIFPLFGLYSPLAGLTLLGYGAEEGLFRPLFPF